jgi:glycosyltransferase involved in cell wall biosynthesis
VSYEVLIPCHNAAATIGDTIASLLDQTEPPARILVLDDGSTDGSAAVVSRASQRSVRIVQLEHRGVCAAQNLGLELVDAELVAFVDADDVWGPAAGAQLAALLRQAPATTAAAGTAAVRFWDGAAPPFELLDAIDPDAVRLDARMLWRRNPLVKSATMFRTEWLRAVGGWRLLPGSEDYDLLLRLYAAGFEVLRSPRRHCLLRLRPASATTRAAEMLAGHLDAVRTFAASARVQAELGDVDYPRRAASAWCRTVSTAAYYGTPLGDVPSLSAVDPGLRDVPVLEAVVRHPLGSRLLASGMNGARPLLTRLGVGRAAA